VKRQYPNEVHGQIVVQIMNRSHAIAVYGHSCGEMSTMSDQNIVIIVIQATRGNLPAPLASSCRWSKRDRRFQK
jgi:hypothetical protein